MRLARPILRNFEDTIRPSQGAARNSKYPSASVLADALVSPGGRQLDELPEGALIGSSSLRRQAQLKLMRPDLNIEPLRGNVNTRLAKLDNGDFDAIILAAAGLERLGLDHYISQQF